MRPLLLLALILSAFAADMEHRRVVLKSGEELVGWWAADQGVLYLNDGKRRLLDNPEQVKSVRLEPTTEKAPDRIQFKRLPDLPFGSVAIGDQARLGWYHAESGTFFAQVEPEPFYDPRMTKMIAVRQSPGPMPERSRNFLNRWAVEQAPEHSRSPAR